MMCIIVHLLLTKLNYCTMLSGKTRRDCEISYDRLYFIQINFNKINLNKNKLNLQKCDFYVYWQRKRVSILKEFYEKDRIGG